MISPREVRRPLTTVAHDAVAAVLFDGAKAIDATMGNGHDTLFLARQVGPNGKVIAFDIQPDALTKTAQRVEALGIASRVDLRQVGHETLLRSVPASWTGAVNAVMFNLGYLPGGDKRCVTRASTTRQALDQTIQLLTPGGRLSILLYRHHDGAEPEVDAVTRWLAGLPDACRVDAYDSRGPVLYLVTV